MSDALQNLMFTIDLMDQVTGPAGKIQNSIEGVTDTFSKVAGGAAGVAAAGYAIAALAAPANEFNMAIGEVRSLDVAQDSLDMLADNAIAFSIKYGESAKDFVSSSYDIQSAIAGLSGEELSSFTNASNILAKGTKADAATITDYMGTMYGIFADDANAMGKAEWVEQLTGQTATAVQMFKTTGSEMAAGFSALGSSAAAMGVPMTEQLAVLGTLQATMSGSEAATKYTAFIGGAVKAQDELGLSLFDAAGKMKPMTEVLGLINGKVGELGSDEQYDVLMNAFGSGEAVKLIQNLIPKVDELGGSITDLGDVSGMDKAMTMADSMVDPFQRWLQGTKALRIGLGQALLPVLIPVVEGMADGAGAMYNWMQEYPTLTKYIGYAVIGVTALTAGVAAFALVGGVASMVTMGYGVAVSMVSGIMSIFRGVMLAGQVAMWLMNGAMWANPALLIAGGVVLLTGVIAAAIYYWDDLKATFMDSTWGQSIMGWIEKIMAGFGCLSEAWSWLKEKFSWVPGMGEDPMADMPNIQEGLAPVPGMVESKPQANITPVPGLVEGPVAEALKPHEGFSPVSVLANEPLAEIPKTSPSLEASKRMVVPAGGVSQSIANAVTNNSESSSQTIHIGQITTSRPINKEEVTNHLVMAS